MKIAIDISSVIYGTGVSVYTRNLVENLLQMNGNNDYVLFGGSFRRREELKKFLNTLRGTNFLGKVYPIPPIMADLLWNRVHLLPIENLVGRVEVFHSSDWTQPPSKAFKVTTVHDLTPLLYPQFTPDKVVSVHKARLRWVLKDVDRVIVPTHQTASDLMKLGFTQDKTRIIPEAVDPSFMSVEKSEIERVKTKLNVKTKYLLSVGVGKRKNTNSIIRAFRNIRKQFDMTLVIIGFPYLSVKPEENVIFTGFIDQNMLPPLYSGAEALVYPSLYEGFGLPILEAYSSKIPVVTSNLGSMAEVAGKGAVLVNPQSPDDISAGIVKAITNREKLMKSGLKELEKYSWKRTAGDTLKVYSEAS